MPYQNLLQASPSPSSYLCSCDDLEKRHLCSLNIMADIVKILDMFQHEPEVISEVFGVIACLSSLPEFVESLGQKGAHRQVQ